LSGCQHAGWATRAPKGAHTSRGMAAWLPGADAPGAMAEATETEVRTVQCAAARLAAPVTLPQSHVLQASSSPMHGGSRRGHQHCLPCGALASPARCALALLAPAPPRPRSARAPTPSPSSSFKRSCAPRWRSGTSCRTTWRRCARRARRACSAQVGSRSRPRPPRWLAVLNRARRLAGSVARVAWRCRGQGLCPAIDRLAPSSTPVG
jgi:hypothetical protein